MAPLIVGGKKRPRQLAAEQASLILVASTSSVNRQWSICNGLVDYAAGIDQAWWMADYVASPAGTWANLAEFRGFSAAAGRILVYVFILGGVFSRNRLPSQREPEHPRNP